jgi:prevent-host-death family protein
MRRSAAIAELKANLSRYVSRVKAGNILITERDRVASLVPIAAERDVDDLRDLERQV